LEDRLSSGLVVMLREGLEAALIVAIVLAYLKRLGREKDFRTVWAGTAAAIAASVVVGAIVFAAVGELQGRAEQLTEGIIAFTAAGVLTWMIFWMGRQARLIKGELQAKVDAAVKTGSVMALAGIAFVAVLREGIESALFMLSTTVGEASNGGAFVGGLLGTAAAAGIGYLVYRGSRKVNLRVFFRVTGVLIILFAAGLVSKGLHEFQEMGSIGTVSEHVYDVSSVSALDADASTSGEFLKGLFGWSPNPSLEMLFAYFAYLIPVGGTFLRMTRKVPLAVPAAQKEATQQETVASTA
jgi:high-affinity iron transporter